MPRSVRPALVGPAIAVAVLGSLAIIKASNNILNVVVYDDPTMERVVDALRAWGKKAKVEVQLTRLSYDALFDEVRNNGAKRDLMLIDDPWLPALVNADVLRPVTDKTLHLRMREFAPEFSEVCYYRKKSRSSASTPKRPTLQVRRCGEFSDKLDGCAELDNAWDLYALPVIGNVQLLVVADDLLPGTEKSITWPALSLALSQHAHSRMHQTAERPPRFVFRTGSGNAALADFLPFLRAWGSHMIVDAKDSSEEVTLEKNESNDALNFGLDLARSSPVQHARLNDRDIYDYLANDEAEAGICWLAYYTRMEPERKHQATGPGQHAKLRPLPMPAPNNVQPTSDDPEQNRAGVTGAWLLAVGNKAPNRRQAWKFIEYVTRKDVADHMRDKGNPPAHESLLDRPINQVPAVTFRDVVRAARPRYAHPCWKEIENVVGLRVQQAYWHTLTPDDALSRATQDLTAIIKKAPLTQTAVSCNTSE